MEKPTGRVHRLRPSPNEEAQLVREELERRRRLRVRQVREQERCIAQQVRRGVQQRTEKELNNLSATLRDDWQNQRGEKLQSLEELHQQSVRAVGQSHRSAQHTEPDWCALTRIAEENEDRAIRRHQQALQDLASQRKEAQSNRQTEARKKALIVEKKRAVKVANLPRPGPNPIESIQTPEPTAACIQHYSSTYCHIPDTPAQQGAVLEAQRVDELERWRVWNEQEQLEMARLRGGHALQKEKVIQASATLLCELECLQQADLQERRQVVFTVADSAFQPVHRRDEQQRDLEIAFQDLYRTGQEVRGRFAQEPEPLPAGGDEDLDVTLESSSSGKTEEEEESAASLREPEVNSGQTAVKRLLTRIRTQREQWSQREPPSPQEKAELESTSIETGSLTNQEQELDPSLQEDKSSLPQTTSCPTESEESFLDRSILPMEDQLTKTQRGLWGVMNQQIQQEAPLYGETPHNAV